MSVFWSLFRRESNSLEVCRCQGLCSLSRHVRCNHVRYGGPGQGPTNPGPIVALACEPPRTICSKSRTWESGQEPVKGVSRRDQFTYFRLLPLGRLLLSPKADARDDIPLNKEMVAKGVWTRSLGTWITDLLSYNQWTGIAQIYAIAAPLVEPACYPIPLCRNDRKNRKRPAPLNSSITQL